MASTNYTDNLLNFNDKPLLEQNREDTIEREAQMTDENVVDKLSKRYQSYSPTKKIGESFNVDPFGTDIPSSIKEKYLRNFAPENLEDPNRFAAGNQPWTAQASNAIVGGIASGVLTAGEGIAWLPTIIGHLGRLDEADTWQNNVVATGFSKLKNTLNQELMPIYQTDPNDPINLKDKGFYWSMLRGILDSAVGFGIPGVAISKPLGTLAAKLAGEFAGVLGKFGAAVGTKTASQIAGSLTSGMISNAVEGMTMGAQTFTNSLDAAKQNYYKEVVESLKTNPIYDNDPELLQLTANQIYQDGLANGKEKKFRESAGQAADDVVVKNRIFALSDALAFRGLFTGTSYLKNMVEKQTWGKFGLNALKQAPIEYGEEIGQGAMQSEAEYQSMKRTGQDVSDVPVDYVDRTIKFLSSEQNQLEGLMGLISGPIQFAGVQAKSYKKSMKDNNELFNKQETDVKGQQAYLNANFQKVVANERARKKAVLQGKDKKSDDIKDELLQDLAYTKFELGTWESFAQNIQDIADGKVKPENADENTQANAKAALAKLEEYKKDYLNIRRNETVDKVGELRARKFATMQKKRVLDAEHSSLISKVADAKSKMKEYQDLTDEDKEYTDKHLQLEALQDEHDRLVANRLGVELAIKQNDDHLSAINQKVSDFTSAKLVTRGKTNAMILEEKRQLAEEEATLKEQKSLIDKQLALKAQELVDNKDNTDVNVISKIKQDQSDLQKEQSRLQGELDSASALTQQLDGGKRIVANVKQLDFEHRLLSKRKTQLEKKLSEQNDLLENAESETEASNIRNHINILTDEWQNLDRKQNENRSTHKKVIDNQDLDGRIVSLDQEYNTLEKQQEDINKQLDFVNNEVKNHDTKDVEDLRSLVEEQERLNKEKSKVEDKIENNRATHRTVTEQKFEKEIVPLREDIVLSPHTAHTITRIENGQDVSQNTIREALNELSLLNTKLQAVAQDKKDRESAIRISELRTRVAEYMDALTKKSVAMKNANTDQTGFAADHASDETLEQFNNRTKNQRNEIKLHDEQIKKNRFKASYVTKFIEERKKRAEAAGITPELLTKEKSIAAAELLDLIKAQTDTDHAKELVDAEWQNLNNKKWQQDEINKLHAVKAGEKIFEELKEKAKQVNLLDGIKALLPILENKIISIKDGGKDFKVILDPLNPTKLINAEEFIKERRKAKSKSDGPRITLTTAILDQLKAPIFDSSLEGEPEIGPEALASYFASKTPPEKSTKNGPDPTKNPNISEGGYADSHKNLSKPDFNIVGFGKTATGGTNIYTQTPEEYAAIVKQTMGIDITTAQAAKLIDDQKAFFAITQALSVGYHKYGLMLVSSSNNPFGDELLFLEKENSHEYLMDVKTIVVEIDGKGQYIAPYRLNGNLIYSSMMLPTLVSYQGNIRFALKDKDGKDIWDQKLFGDKKVTSQELIKAIKDPKVKDQVNRRLDQYKNLRKRAIDAPSGNNIVAKIISKSNGVENQSKENPIRNIKGILVDEDTTLSHINIDIPTSSQPTLEIDGDFNLKAKPGFIYLVDKSNIYELKPNTLADEDIYKLVLLLKAFSKNITDGEKTNSPYLKDKDGKFTDKHIFSMLNNMIYFGDEAKHENTEKVNVKDPTKRRTSPFFIGYEKGGLSFGPDGKISDDDLIDGSIVLNEDGTIDEAQTSEKIIKLITFMRNLYHHVNKKTLVASTAGKNNQGQTVAAEDIELYKLGVNEKGEVFYTGNSDKTNYKTYLLKGNRPRLGTKNNGTIEGLDSNVPGKLSNKLTDQEVINAKNNPRKRGVYLNFSTGELQEVKTEVTKATTKKKFKITDIVELFDTNQNIVLELTTNKGKSFTAKINSGDNLSLDPEHEGLYQWLEVYLGKLKSEELTTKDKIEESTLFGEILTDAGLSVKISVEEVVAKEEAIPEPDNAAQVTAEELYAMVAAALNDGVVPTNGNQEAFMEFNINDVLKVGKINVDQELAWFRERFTQFPISVQRKLIDGRYSGKLLRNATVLISELAAAGTTYHEAWHVVSFLMSSPEEQALYYKEYKKLYNRNISDSKAEEEIAELFREYVRSGGNMRIRGIQSKNIFSRIYNFIKELFGLDKSELEKKFASIYNNTHNKEVLHNTLARDVFSEGPFTARHLVELNESITTYFLRHLFNPTSEIFKDMFSMGYKDFNAKYKNEIGSLYSLTFSDINTALKDKLTQLQVARKKATDKRIIDALTKATLVALENKNAIESNWDMLVERNKLHLNKFGIESSYEDDMEDDDRYGNVKDSAQHVESSSFSQMAKAGTIMKMFIASIPALHWTKPDAKGNTAIAITPNSFGLRGSSNYVQLFQNIHNLLAGQTSYVSMVKVLKDNVYRFPEFQAVLERLGSDNEAIPNAMSLSQAGLITNFHQQFSKTRDNYQLVLVGYNGETTIIDPQRNAVRDIAIRKWQSNQRMLWSKNTSSKTSNDTLIKLENGITTIDNEKFVELSTGKRVSISTANKMKLTLTESLELLTKVGIELYNYKNLDGLLDTESKKALLGHASYIFNQLAEAEKLSDIFDRNDAEINNAISSIAVIDAISNPNVIELQHINVEGKKVYGITLNSYLSILVNKMIKDGVNPKINNSRYSDHSIWKDHSKSIRVNVIEGLRKNSSGAVGKKVSKSSTADRMVTSIAAVFNGISPFLRSADREREFGIYVPGFGKRMGIKQFTSYLKNHLIDEVNASIQARDNVDFTYDRYNNNIKKLRFFKDILGDIDLSKFNSYMDFEREIGIGIINQALNQYAVNLRNDTIQLFKDNLIFRDHNNGTKEERSTVTVNGISKTHLNSLINETHTMLNGEEQDIIASTYAYNFVIGNIEQTKLITGDPAYYNYRDFFKRMNGITGTKKVLLVDQEFNDYLNTSRPRSDGKVQDGKFSIYIIDDIIVKSNHYKDGINEADSQGYISLDAYREFLTRANSWTPDQEDLYNWIVESRTSAPTRRKPVAIFPPLKPQHFGYDEDASQYVPLMLKLSLIPIYPELFSGNYKNSKLKDVHEKMSVNGVDMVMFESVAKGIGRKMITKNGMVLSNPLFQKNGEVKEFNKDFKQTILLENFGLQLDIAPKMKENATFGTQFRTLISSNMYKGAIPIDYTGADWDSLTEKEKQDNSEIYKLDKELQDLLNLKTRNKLRDVLNELTIKYNGDTKMYDIEDTNKLIDIIVNEMVDRDSPDNAIESVKTALKHEIKYLDLTSNKEKIEHILFSLITNNVIRQKFNGDMLVQAASTGFEVEARKQKNDTFTSNADTLKFYGLDKDGNSTGMEVYAPHFFREYFKGGDQIRINRTADGVEILRNGKVVSTDSRLLMTVGFRTPTSGLNSIEMITIKDFLPPEAGAVIIAPSEITMKSGSDYDIDKMTVFFPNNYIDDSGKIVYIDPNNIKESYSDYIDVQSRKFDRILKTNVIEYFGNNSQIEGSTNSAKILSKQLIDAINNDPSALIEIRKKFIDKIKEIQGSLDMTQEGARNYFVELDGLIDATNTAFFKDKLYRDRILTFDEYSEMASENKVIDIARDVLKSPRVREQLLEPISSTLLKEVATSIAPVSQTTDLSEMFSPKGIFDIAERFWTGVGGIGIAALNITHHVKATRAGLYVDQRTPKTKEFTDGQPLSLPFSRYNVTPFGAISFAGTQDQKGRFISDILNQIGNAIIDIAKDPFPFDINITMETLNVWTTLIRAGVNVEEVAQFMSKPIIKEYFRRVQLYQKSIIADIGGYKKSMTRFAIVEQLKKEFKNDSQYLTALTQKNTGILAIAQEMTNLILGTAFDTKPVTSRPDGRAADRKFNSAYGSPMFGNVDKIVGEDNSSFMASMREVFDTSLKAFNSLFFTDQKDIHAALSSIEGKLTAYRSKDEIKKISTLLHDDFNTFVLQQTVDSNDKAIKARALSLIKGKESVPARLKLASEQSNNPIFGQLIPVLDINVTAAQIAKGSYIQMFGRNLEKFEHDSIVQAFTEMKEQFPELYNDLIDFCILQSGLSPSVISYREIIPGVDFYNRLVDIVGNFVFNKDEVRKFESWFYKNNWLNPLIVKSDSEVDAKVNEKKEFATIDTNNPADTPSFIRVYFYKADKMVLMGRDPDSSGAEDYAGYIPVAPMGDGNKHKQYWGADNLYRKNQIAGRKSNLELDNDLLAQTGNEDYMSGIENVPSRVREFTPDEITSLEPNEIFVFGSNAEGFHGRGAALIARQKFGAKHGQAKGLQGQSYAIITKKNWKIMKSSTLEEIFIGLQEMNQFAYDNPDKKFLVTKLGSSLAGYSIAEIRGLFDQLNKYEGIAGNVVLPQEYDVRVDVNKAITTAPDPDTEPNESPLGLCITKK